MHFNCALCGLVSCPIEQAQTEAYGGGIQKKYFALDSEFYLLKIRMLSQTFKQYVIIVAEQVPVTPLVLIADVGF